MTISRVKKIFLIKIKVGEDMAKKIKKKEKKVIPTKTVQDKLWNILNGKYKHLIFISLLAVIIFGMFFKIAFLGYVPQAHDTKQWRSSAQAIYDYNKTHKDQAFWDTNVFSGMPAYFISFLPKYPYINKLRKITDKVVNWRVFLLFTGALGVYLLMISFGFEAIFAFIAALGFALSSSFLGLIEIGHNTKFRTIIYIPWIFWAVEYLKKKKNLLSIGLLSMFLIGQLRESHPQISYYTFMMIGIWWVMNLIWALKDKKTKDFAFVSVLLLFAVIITLLAVSNPYMNKMEYTKFSMRGGSKGLSKEYATSWSFHPLEILNFINPGFFGEVSPYYWGWMPFTQTSVYMGIILLFLAIIAVIYIKDRRVTFLWIVSAFALILSFGRHFPLLTNFMLDHFPGYNKFRVPATILVLLQFVVVILAGFGLKFIMENYQKDTKLKKHFKNYLIGAIILFVLMLILPSLMTHGFIKTGETAKYSHATIQRLIETRKEIFTTDGVRSAIFLILFIALSLWFISGKLKKSVFVIFAIILIFADIISFDSKFLNELDKKPAKSSIQPKTSVDKFLLKDKEIYRIYPLGADFGDNKWTYYHQSIGGYHGAKLKRYNDILNKCLNSKKYDSKIPINWNIVNMLNTKYIIFSSQLPLPNLTQVFYDEAEGKYVYKNSDYLPRGWFVKKLIYKKDEKSVCNLLNSKAFNPKNEAIVEEKIPGFVFENDIATIKDTTSSAILTNFDANNLSFEVKADTTGFMVISEVYYPAGWKAFIDGKETQIYPVNYILRGIVVPKGEHKVTLKFISETYIKSGLYSLIGIVLSLGFVVVGIIFYFIKRKS